MIETTKQILSFIGLAERLKSELRHSWLSDGRKESVAEHCWQMALMAILLHRHLQYPVDLEKTLKMVIIHDLVEALTGDIPFFEKSKRNEIKAAKESEAIDKIRSMLDGDTGSEIYNLWWEFENGVSKEAKFAKALDNLEVQIQHNLADFSTWEKIEYDLVYSKMDQHCSHDDFLSQFCDAVKHQAESKMLRNHIDVEGIKKRIKN